MTRKSIWLRMTILGASAGFLVAASAAYAADSGKEVATAAQHAGLASKAAAVKQVHTHLHHAVNCLVGPKGEGFDAAEANPCAALGDGAIPDTTDAVLKKKLMEAVKTANAGLASDDLATAQKSAAETEGALKTAM